jgi:diketogulonate reductase-like aldo/keto reductase
MKPPWLSFLDVNLQSVYQCERGRITLESPMPAEMPWLIYGTAWKKEKTTELVETALAAGFAAIDTANQPKHYDEPRVGEALRKAYGAGLSRERIFLQTKFTPVGGQDARVPYDLASPLAEQVAQSLVSSLSHLHTDYLDSYLLHGPYNYPGLGDEDWEVWQALEKIFERGEAKRIGISNVNADQLEALVEGASVKPMVVQNRCYASRGWDREVRRICRNHGIAYQGFSLLTANPEVLRHPFVHGVAERLGTGIAQVVFAFAAQAGMKALTGTTNAQHMNEDLAVSGLTLTPAEMETIENLAG